jgi:hypothetical protein
MLDFARPVGSSAAAGSLGLLTLAGSSLARRPPIGLATDPKTVARTLPLGVVGELRVSGAHVGTLHELESWDLGAVWKK